jgi:hypothetical protein
MTIVPTLTREAILAVPDRTIEEVSIPEWGGKVFVRNMSGAERDQFEASLIEIRGKRQIFDMVNVRAKLVSLSVCDEAGGLLFTEQDVRALGEKSASAIQRIFRVAQRLSGLSEEDVKELTEGLQTNPLGGSASG